MCGRCDLEKAKEELINKIQKRTNSNVISLIYNNTPTRFRTQLAADLLPPLNALLKSIPKNKTKKRVSVVLHSSGGFLDVITSLVYMLRKRFQEFYIIIPEIAHSAATIITFGADKILMSYYSSLSPVDPQITLRSPAGNIGASTEDIEGYYELTNGMFKDDAAKIQAFSLLANRFPPEVLGHIKRVQKQTQMIAAKLLKYHHFQDHKIQKIINKFQKEFFSHDYRIHFDEAKKLGLNVELMDESLEDACLKLLAIYNSSLGAQADIEVEIKEEQPYNEIILNRSYLECVYSSFSYKTKYRVFKDKRVDVEELGWIAN